MARYLTKEEELELGRRIRAMFQVKERLEEKGCEPSGADRTVILDGEAAVEKLTESYQNLVYRMAKSFQRSFRGAPEIEDVVQDGRIGLMNAVRRYDPDRNCKFSTVATHWVKQAITREGNRYGRQVRLPENRIAQLSHINRLREKYADEKLSLSEFHSRVRKELNLSHKDLHSILNAASSPLSLNMTFGDEKRELSDVVDCGQVESAADTVVQRDQDEALARVIDRLDPLSREAVKAKFSIDTPTGTAMAPKEVRSRFKVSPASFNKQVDAALKQMRVNLEAQGRSPF